LLAGDLMLVAVEALEWACELWNENGDGIVFCFQAY